MRNRRGVASLKSPDFVPAVHDRQPGDQQQQSLDGACRRRQDFQDWEPINAKLEACYNVEKPTGAPDYSIAFQFSFLFRR
ncbi:MAG: hypothetical protein AB8G77_11990 [Rhodothermales bacterium]